MKSCVATATFGCDPTKVWLYLTNPMLNHWRTDVSEADISSDGMKVTEKNSDGTNTVIDFTRKEKPRHIDCTFTRGKIKGSFIAILLGGGDSTSLECTLAVEGMGLFTKSKTMMDSYFGMLRRGLGE